MKEEDVGETSTNSEATSRQPWSLPFPGPGRSKKTSRELDRSQAFRTPGSQDVPLEVDGSKVRISGCFHPIFSDVQYK